MCIQSKMVGEGEVFKKIYQKKKYKSFIFKKFELQVKLSKEEYIKHEIELEIKILIEKKTEQK